MIKQEKSTAQVYIYVAVNFVVAVAGLDTIKYKSCRMPCYVHSSLEERNHSYLLMVVSLLLRQKKGTETEN